MANKTRRGRKARQARYDLLATKLLLNAPDEFNKWIDCIAVSRKVWRGAIQDAGGTKGHHDAMRSHIPLTIAALDAMGITLGSEGWFRLQEAGKRIRVPEKVNVHSVETRSGLRPQPVPATQPPRWGRRINRTVRR